MSKKEETVGERPVKGTRSRRHPLLAVVVAAVVLGVAAAAMTYFASMNQTSEYRSRVALIVQPTDAANDDPSNYVQNAGASLPALSELVHSADFMGPVVQGVPGAPTAEELTRATTVEVLPESIVVRVAVTNPDADMAAALVSRVADRVQEADLFAGRAGLRRLQSDVVEPEQVAPDRQLALGLALLIGTAVGAVVSQVLLRVRPLATLGQIRRALGSTTPVLDVSGDQSRDAALGLIRRAENPRIVPVDRASTAMAREIQELVGAPGSERSAGRVLLVVTRGKTPASTLQSFAHLARLNGETVVGVAVG